MNDDGVKKLLRQVKPLPTPGRYCPTEALLAGFADGGLSEQEHHALSGHIADCDYCLVRLGALGRAREADGEFPVPELVRARAERLVAGGLSRPPVWRRAQRWAAAAVLVAAVGLLFLASEDNGLPGTAQDTVSTVSAGRETRYSESLPAGPTLLWPREGIVVDPVGQEFRWTEVFDTLYYDLRIVTDEGDLVWQERVSGTSWNLPAALPLRPGDEYFVRVDAWLNDSKSLNSDYVWFRYGDQP